MASQRDVAKLAGVSSATVSRVLNNSGYVSPELRERVENAISELGYEANPFARGLRVDKSNAVGLVISTIENPFFATVVRGVESEVYTHGYSLLLCNTDSDSERERMYLGLLRQKRVDGLIISTSGGVEDEIMSIVARDVPVVLLNRRLQSVSQGSKLGVDMVMTDSIGGARTAVRHLIDLGHSRIGIVAGPSDHLQAIERLSGYREALSEAGIGYRPDLVYVTSFTEAGGYQGAKGLLSKCKDMTALFVSNNLMALGAIKAIRESGLTMPEDLALVSFDDVDWGPYIDPPLSVVAQSAYEMGVVAVKLLLERLVHQFSGPAREVVLETKFIIRSSCGARP